MGCVKGLQGDFQPELLQSPPRQDRCGGSCPGPCTGEPEPQHPRRAAKTLGDMRSDARNAVPVLTKALEDQDAGVLESAAYALQRINDKEAVTR